MVGQLNHGHCHVSQLYRGQCPISAECAGTRFGENVESKLTSIQLKYFKRNVKKTRDITTTNITQYKRDRDSTEGGGEIETPLGMAGRQRLFLGLWRDRDSYEDGGETEPRLGIVERQRLHWGW